MLEDSVETSQIQKEREERQEVDFLKEKLGLKKGDFILDLGSGQGEHVNILRGQGLKAFGIDRANFPKDGNGFVQGDIGNMPFNESIDAAYILYPSAFPPFTSEYFSKDEFIRLLKEIRRVLKPGGKFLFHQGGNNDTLIESARTNPDVSEYGLKLAEDLFSFGDYKEMFNEAGLPIKETFGDFNGNPYGKGSEATIFISQKVL